MIGSHLFIVSKYLVVSLILKALYLCLISITYYVRYYLERYLEYLTFSSKNSERIIFRKNIYPRKL